MAALIPRMAFHIEPEVSCSRFLGRACFTAAGLVGDPTGGGIEDLARTEAGGFVADRLGGGLFIDAPCGRHALAEAGVDFDVTALAAALGAGEIWEVDLTADVIADRVEPTPVIEDGRYLLTGGIGPIGRRAARGVPTATMQDDVLGFLAKTGPETSPKAFFLSALQPDSARCAEQAFQRETAVPYLHALYDELARACVAGDLAILASSAMLVEGLDDREFPLHHPAIALGGRGFSLERRCAYDKVHVFAKE